MNNYIKTIIFFGLSSGTCLKINASNQYIIGSQAVIIDESKFFKVEPSKETISIDRVAKIFPFTYQNKSFKMVFLKTPLAIIERADKNLFPEDFINQTKGLGACYSNDFISLETAEQLNKYSVSFIKDDLEEKYDKNMEIVNTQYEEALKSLDNLEKPFSLVHFENSNLKTKDTCESLKYTPYQTDIENFEAINAIVKEAFGIDFTEKQDDNIKYEFQQKNKQKIINALNTWRDN